MTRILNLLVLNCFYYLSLSRVLCFLFVVVFYKFLFPVLFSVLMIHYNWIYL